MAYTKLIPRHTKDARIEEIPRDTLHYPLSVTAGKADKYHLAQPDDYAHVLRSEFPLAVPTWHHFIGEDVEQSVPGTWRFGLWNILYGERCFHIL